MLHSHAKHSEFVELAGHGVTRGNHGRQLVDQVIHLVPPPFFNLAVRFPMDRQLVYQCLFACDSDIIRLNSHMILSSKSQDFKSH